MYTFIMRLIGLVILCLGIVLLVFGLNSTEAWFERVVEKITGRYTDTTMWYIIGGVVALIVGSALTLGTFFGKKK